MSDPISSGKRLKAYIDGLGLSQAAFARVASLDRSDLTKFIKDKKQPTNAQMLRICQKLTELYNKIELVDSRAIWP